MGKVFAAQHPRLPREDALKVLSPVLSADPVFRQRFEREAQLAARLEHPNIVPVYDCGEADGRLWISMRLVHGPTAGDLIRDAPRGLPASQVIEICRAVGRALDFAHSSGMLHRDIKPENILIDQRNDMRQVVLSDFGIARLEGDPSLTGTGMVFGTVDYCSPEQLNGGECDGRSDQYSLACTAARLLTGVKPFTAPTPSAIMLRHLSSERPSIATGRPELPTAIDEVFRKALAVAPQDRYDSCLQFADALDSALQSTVLNRQAPDPGQATLIAPAAAVSASSPSGDPTVARPASATRPVPPHSYAATSMVPPNDGWAGGPHYSVNPPPPARRRHGLLAIAVVVPVLLILGSILGYTLLTGSSDTEEPATSPMTNAQGTNDAGRTAQETGAPRTGSETSRDGQPPSSGDGTSSPRRQHYDILDTTRRGLNPCAIPANLLVSGGMNAPLQALPQSSEILLCSGTFTDNAPAVLMGGYVEGSETARWVIEQYNRGTPAFDDLSGWRRYDATDREQPITRCKYGFVSRTTPRYAFEVTVIRSPQQRDGFDARARAAACNRLANIARAIDPAMPQD